MKNIYIACNTHYQIINAIQMKTELFPYERVFVSFSNHSVASRKTVEKLKFLHVFFNVFYIETKHLVNPRLKKTDKMSSVINGIKGNDFGMDFGNNSIDEFYYYNDNLANLAIYAFLYRRNKNIVCCRFDEGMGSYIEGFDDNKKISLIRKTRKVLKRKNLFDSTYYFMCYRPDLCLNGLRPKRIPQINLNSKSIEILKNLYMDSDVDYTIHQDYIFFGTTYDFEGDFPIGEHALVKRIAELVGTENLIVKAHPRDFSDKYTEMGITLYEHSDIPWEILQLTQDFSGKTFLTTVSTSVMSLNMALDKPVKTLYMYNLCDAKKNKFAKKTIDMFHRFRNEKNFNPENYNIHIIRTWEDILK